MQHEFHNLLSPASVHAGCRGDWKCGTNHRNLPSYGPQMSHPRPTEILSLWASQGSKIILYCCPSIPKGSCTPMHDRSLLPNHIHRNGRKKRWRLSPILCRGDIKVMDITPCGVLLTVPWLHCRTWRKEELEKN